MKYNVIVELRDVSGVRIEADTPEEANRIMSDHIYSCGGIKLPFKLIRSGFKIIETTKESNIIKPGDK